MSEKGNKDESRNKGKKMVENQIKQEQKEQETTRTNPPNNPLKDKETTSTNNANLKENIYENDTGYPKPYYTKVKVNRVP